MTETIPSLSSKIAKHLRSRRSAISTEDGLQRVVAEVLAQSNVHAIREHALSRADRVDFFIPDGGIAIELKKAGLGQGDLRQIGRYLNHAEVQCCLAIAMRVTGLPSTFMGKPIHVIELWKLLL